MNSTSSLLIAIPLSFLWISLFCNFSVETFSVPKRGHSIVDFSKWYRILNVESCVEAVLSSLGFTGNTLLDNVICDDGFYALAELIRSNKVLHTLYCPGRNSRVKTIIEEILLEGSPSDLSFRIREQVQWSRSDSFGGGSSTEWNVGYHRTLWYRESFPFSSPLILPSLTFLLLHSPFYLLSRCHLRSLVWRVRVSLRFTFLIFVWSLLFTPSSASLVMWKGWICQLVLETSRIFLIDFGSFFSVKFIWRL